MFNKIIKYAGNDTGKIYISILQSFLSVAFGILPFFKSYQIIVKIINFEDLSPSYILVIFYALINSVKL